jgi:hypothetical protein
MMTSIPFQRGTALTFDMAVVVASSNLLYTGLVKADFNISKDGAAFAALNASSTVTEIGTTGIYTIVLDAATDATCDRFIIRCTQATAAQRPTMGRSKIQLQQVDIKGSFSGVGSAPVLVENTNIATDSHAVSFIINGTNAVTNAGLAFLGRLSGTITFNNGHGVTFSKFANNSAGLYFDGCNYAIGANDCFSALVGFTGSPGAAGGKLVKYATLSSTAPTGPILDFTGLTVAQLVDWTCTPASSNPIARITAGGAGSAVEIRNSSSGAALAVKNTGTGDGALLQSASSTTGYALNLDMGTVGMFGMRIDGPFPETTGAVSGLDFFACIGRMLADQLNKHTLDKDTQVATTFKRDGTTTLHTRNVSDDGSVQTVGALP